jgi:predicted ATP-dependent serine protease
MNLLTPEDYKVSRATERKRLVDLDRFEKVLKQEAPDFAGSIIDGFEIVGKTSVFQQYIGKKESIYYAINISRKTREAVQEKRKEIMPMNLKTVKLKDIEFDDSLFVPIKSETAVDYCFSTEGGIMPATNYIVIGDPGIGKSSMAIQYAADIQEQNKDKRILFISAEMTMFDMKPYAKRFPLWEELDILFVSTMTEGMYKESIEAKLKEGWDLVVIDSFAELADAVRGDYNETAKGADKKTYNDIEKWLVDQMVLHNSGENTNKRYTSFISIQQVTKGGTFVGSNKLKHNTTGMLELRYTKTGSRRIHISKNRRGFDYQDLEFEFSEDTNEPIVYNIEKIERDKKIQQEIKKVQAQQLDEELLTDKWFEEQLIEEEEIS